MNSPWQQSSPLPSEAPGERDIYPAPSQCISFRWDRCLLSVLPELEFALPKHHDSFLSPVPPTSFGGAHPAELGAGSVLKTRAFPWAPSCASDTPLVTLSFLSHRVTPRCQGIFPLLPWGWCHRPCQPSSQPCPAGLCQPGCQDSRAQQWPRLGGLGSAGGCSQCTKSSTKL